MLLGNSGREPPCVSPQLELLALPLATLMMTLCPEMVHYSQEQGKIQGDTLTSHAV